MSCTACFDIINILWCKGNANPPPSSSSCVCRAVAFMGVASVDARIHMNTVMKRSTPALRSDILQFLDKVRGVSERRAGGSSQAQAQAQAHMHTHSYCSNALQLDVPLCEKLLRVMAPLNDTLAAQLFCLQWDLDWDRYLLALDMEQEVMTKFLEVRWMRSYVYSQLSFIIPCGSNSSTRAGHIRLQPGGQEESHRQEVRFEEERNDGLGMRHQFLYQLGINTTQHSTQPIPILTRHSFECNMSMEMLLNLLMTTSDEPKCPICTARRKIKKEVLRINNLVDKDAAKKFNGRERR